MNNPAPINSISDSATAVFSSADYGPNPVTVPAYSSSLQASVGSCTVTVTFTPTATGSRSASVSIDGGYGLQAVALSGTGT